MDSLCTLCYLPISLGGTYFLYTGFLTEVLQQSMEKGNIRVCHDCLCKYTKCDDYTPDDPNDHYDDVHPNDVDPFIDPYPTNDKPLGSGPEYAD